MKFDPLKEAVAEAIFLYDQDEPWDEATGTSRREFLRMADAAIRGMDRTDAWELFRTMANILDGYMPILEEAATAEISAETGKEFPRITQRSRFKAARQAVDRAFDMLGLEP